MIRFSEFECGDSYTKRKFEVKLTNRDEETIDDDGLKISNNTIERMKKRKEYQKLLEGMTPKDISLVLLEIPHQLSNCANEISKYKKELSSIILKMDKVYGELYHDFKFGISNKQYRYTTKAEIEGQIKAHPRWQNVARERNALLARIEFWEQTGESLKQTGFAIKNYNDLQKHLSGEF